MSTTSFTSEDLSGTGQQRVLLFQELDRRAREIEEQCKSTWVELADLCMTVRDNSLWKEGGYHSFNAWLLSACPTSRSVAYLAIGVREALPEIPDEDLKQIPLSNAEVLTQTPKKQRSKLLRSAKRQTPREFVATVVREAPESHVEQKQCHKFRLATSGSKVLQACLEMWRILNDDPEAPAEVALEGVVSEYMTDHQDEYERKKRNGLSRR